MKHRAFATELCLRYAKPRLNLTTADGFKAVNFGMTELAVYDNLLVGCALVIRLLYTLLQVQHYRTRRINHVYAVGISRLISLWWLSVSPQQYFHVMRTPDEQIVIYGKLGHAEVNGLVGQTDGNAIVVDDSPLCTLRKVSCRCCSSFR